MKDIPSAVMICLSLYLFVLLLKKLSKNLTSHIKIQPPTSHFSFKIISYLLLSAIAVGISFNTKINAILIPPIIFLWLLISFRDQIKIALPKIWQSHIGPIYFLPLTFYLLLSIIFSLAIWWPFWAKPIDSLFYIYRHFSKSTTGFWILYYGKIYLSNINVPWHYALGYLTAVTPVFVIFLFVIGFIKATIDTITLKNRYSGLILSWFLIPTLKYIDPKVGILDGIRHFLEVLFPIAILAGIGINQILILCKRAGKIFLSNTESPTNPKATTREITAANKGQEIFIRRALLKLNISNFALYTLSFALILYSLFQIVPLHPYETAYYSEWLGGVKGANGKFDIEYWGNALKEGSSWLNKNAPPNAEISVPMAQQVAKEYLRPDLKVVQYPKPSSNYLMFINRSSFFDMYTANNILRYYITSKKPIFTITRENTPLLWIYKYPIQ